MYKEISLSFYSFITRDSFGQPFSTNSMDNKRISINWVMPPPSPESGGHINIFRFISGLENRGFDCRVVVCNDGIGSPISTSTADLFEQINEWYGAFNGTVYYSSDMPPCTITMATGWQTAYVVKQFRSTAHKGYFVQDFEPSFYPAGAEACFAEQTYKFGFTGYTAGSWLADLLRSEYGMRTYPVSFSYDKSLYFKRANDNPSVKHLLCYVRPVTIRRGWELVNLTLEIIHKRDPEIKFILVGGEIDRSNINYPAFNPGSVRVAELGKLYSQCRAALILSCTNLSLLPLEVMSCGVPVISNKGKNVEWLLNDDNSTLADLNPESMAESVMDVLELSDDDHEKLSSKSMSFANRTDWESEHNKFCKILLEQTCSLQQVAA